MPEDILQEIVIVLFLLKGVAKRRGVTLGRGSQEEQRWALAKRKCGQSRNNAIASMASQTGLTCPTVLTVLILAAFL